MRCVSWHKEAHFDISLDAKMCHTNQTNNNIHDITVYQSVSFVLYKVRT